MAPQRSGQARARSSRATSAKGERIASVLYVGDVEVHVTRKRVKNITLQVKAPDGRVTASAPYHVTDAYLLALVEKRLAWIKSQQEALAASPRAHAEQASAEEVETWRAVVSACVPALIETWEPILGVRAGKLAYRNMKSRWGSCQPSTGRICINVRLALYPPECLEYVVVHELCHLLVHDHGPDFHGLLDRVMPDWRERRAKLR